MLRDEECTHEQTALIFTRLIIDGLISNMLDPQTAGKWATHAGHYGNLALKARADEANAVHRLEIASADNLMHNLMAFTRSAYRIQAPK